VNLCAAGGACLATTIWQVDAGQRCLTFDAAPGGAAMDGLVGSDEVTAIAHLDAVRLQFELHGLMLVHGEHSSALQAALPPRIHRYQRRDAFRVSASAHSLPTAEFRHPAHLDVPLALRVLDVGAGGCALRLPEDVPAPAAGTTIAGARLRLDIDTVIHATLQVQHVSAIAPGSGGTRLGCALLGLSGQAACALQRWIDRVQQRGRPFGG